METREAYALTECPQNGTGGPPDAPKAISYRIDRLVVQVIVAKEQNGLKIGEVSFNPATLFADPMAFQPWGSSLELLLGQAIGQAEQQG